MRRILRKLWWTLEDIVSDVREPDAKRLGGFLGWIACVIISIIGVFVEIKSPYIVETLFWTSTLLLGIDGVTDIVRVNKNMNIDKKISHNREESLSKEESLTKTENNT